MTAERFHSIKVAVVLRPGDSQMIETTVTVLYCDRCRRWGSLGSVHLCDKNWWPRLSELLTYLGLGVRS